LSLNVVEKCSTQADPDGCFFGWRIWSGIRNDAYLQRRKSFYLFFHDREIPGYRKRIVKKKALESEISGG
jgi:hypothetical protein